MEENMRYYINSLIERYPALNGCEESIIKTYDILVDCFSSGNKLLIAGNGGSNSDAEHIAGELMKGFKLARKCPEEFTRKLKSIDSIRGEELARRLQGGLPVIALGGHQSLNTAFINDIPEGGLYAFAQQVYAYGKKGDVLLAISTSGNSKNVLNATVVAKALGMMVVSLTGKDGGELKKMSHASIVAPSSETYMIQEFHLPIYHCICLMLEEHFYRS